ncbi:hypothetical protein IG631_17154 [Alternaria alternata]|nr:hypothetical protein IG631_17154 [Alternaria alternata]
MTQGIRRAHQTIDPSIDTTAETRKTPRKSEADHRTLGGHLRTCWKSASFLLLSASLPWSTSKAITRTPGKRNYASRVPQALTGLLDVRLYLVVYLHSMKLPSAAHGDKRIPEKNHWIGSCVDLIKEVVVQDPNSRFLASQIRARLSEIDLSMRDQKGTWLSQRDQTGTWLSHELPPLDTSMLDTGIADLAQQVLYPKVPGSMATPTSQEMIS